MTRRAIFLDRDGVINENRPDHVKAWTEFRFLPRTLDALRRIASSDYVTLVMTNQSGVQRGTIPPSILNEIHTRMNRAIIRAGGRVDAIFVCPHSPEENCDCRKPRTKMYRDAARDWDIDFARSYVIGDSMADVQAGQGIGATPILVLTGRGEDQYDLLLESNHSGFHVLADLWQAVEWIWERENILLAK